MRMFLPAFNYVCMLILSVITATFVYTMLFAPPESRFSYVEVTSLFILIAYVLFAAPIQMVLHRHPEKFRRRDLLVRDGYGQTESTLLVGVLKGMDIKPGSMGKPTPGNEVEIIDENGQICAPGEIGDIAVHLETPALFKEYYKDAERTKAQRRGDYFITGDRAKKDEDGYFWFESRRDDIIVSSGYTIGPFEVEDALIKHPAVKECAVVASPDEIRGSIVKAYVVLRDASAQSDELIKELQTHVKNTTAPYKYPREIEFIDELPKTPSAKIRRVELRERELARKSS